MSFLFIAAVLAGCKKNKANESEGSESDSAQSERVDGLAFGTDLLPSFRVVYHQNADAELIEASQTLAATLQKIYGVEVKSNSDYLRENSEIFCEVEYEILVGKTNREVETDFYENMLAEDYGFTAVGTKILICGGNDHRTTEAVTDFSYEVLAKNKNKYEGVFYTTAFDKYHKGSYAFDSLTVNGVSIKDYTVVTPAMSNAFEESLADRLIETVKRLTGYTLAQKSDGKAYDGGYEILIGKTNRDAALTATETAERSGKIAAKDKLIALYGNGALGNSEAVEAFIELMKAEADKGRNGALTVSAVDAPADTSITTMSYNLAVSDISTARRQRVLAQILYYLPDIIGTQEANQTWVGYLSNTLPRYYGFVGDGREGGTIGERCLILYSKERFELLDSDTVWFSGKEAAKEDNAQYIRIYTYAKLKDKTTGENFLFLNTHLDTANDAVRAKEVGILLEFLKGYTDIPVILTGDLNCGAGTVPIQMLLQTSFESVFDMTDDKYGSNHIDWIMAIDTGVTVSSARVCDERVNGYYTSDHYPIYSELEIKTPEGGIENNWDKVYPTSPEGYLQPEHDKDGGGFDPVISFDGFFKNEAEQPTDPEGGGTQEPEGGGTQEPEGGGTQEPEGGGTQEPEGGSLGTPEDTDGEDFYPILPF